ncbi:MAG: hypothetical protein DRP87_13085 [Spirochaetes bacterium]|nr:MAG: hypothetical protein DRP87_13085 [Spirochaetota bacterium]
MDFFNRLQEALNQGLETSRELFSKAKDRAKDLGEKGVLRFEIKQLENQAEKLVAQLGSRVYQVLMESGQNTVSKKTSGIKQLLDEIEDIRKRVEEKEKELKKYEEK